MNSYIEGLFNQLLTDFQQRLQQVCELVATQFLNQQKCIDSCLSTLSVNCSQLISKMQADFALTCHPSLKDILDETVDPAELEDIVIMEKEQPYTCKMCKKKHSDRDCAYCWKCARDLGRLVYCKRCKVTVINKKGRCRECTLILA